MVRHLAATLCLAALLTGCSDAPEPDFADPTTEVTSEPTTAPPTSEPTSTAPTTSAAPAALTPEETVRAWVEARNEFLNSGDPQLVRRLSEGCGSCAGLIDSIAEIYVSGGYVRSDGWTIDRLAKTPDFESSRIVTGAVTIGGGETQERAGGKIVNFPPEKVILDFTLTKRERIWSVRDVVFLS